MAEEELTFGALHSRDIPEARVGLGKIRGVCQRKECPVPAHALIQVLAYDLLISVFISRLHTTDSDSELWFSFHYVLCHP